MVFLYIIKRWELIGNGKLCYKGISWGKKQPNPADRAKSGTKRSIVVDGKGVPLGITVVAANRHDMKNNVAKYGSRW